MPFTFILKSFIPAQFPYAVTSSKSTALPGTATLNTSFSPNLAIMSNFGSSNTAKQGATLAQTARQAAPMLIMSSPPLQAQTFSAATWTIAHNGYEGNAAANAFTAASLYVWTPSTSTVRGYLYDSSNTIGSEWSSGGTQPILFHTFSGLSVSAQEDDILVFELWYIATQAMATSYTIATGTNVSPGGYLETSQTNAVTFKELTQSFIID